MFERFMRFFIILFTKTIFIKKINGLDNLPNNGPYVIVSNHASYFDHFLIYTIMNHYANQRVYFLTKKEAFDSYLSRKWHLAMGAIPLNRDGTDVSAYKTVVKALKKGKIVCIYPEGTRSPTGKIYHGKQGAIRMALAANVPIVPVGLSGTFDILPRKTLWPRFMKATVQIDKPITLSKKCKEELEDDLRMIMNKLKYLSGDTDKSIKDLPTEKSSLIQEMLNVAYEWNERGIRQYPKDTLSPDTLHKRAVYICDQVLTMEKNHPIALFEKSRAIGRLGLNSKSKLKKVRYLRKGKNILEESIKADPTHAPSYYALAVWYMEMPESIGGSVETALSLYKKATELEKEIYIMIGYAKALLQSGNPDAAKEVLSELITEIPIKNKVDSRRKVEAIAMIMRIDPNFQLEEKVMSKCFLSYQTG